LSSINLRELVKKGATAGKSLGKDLFSWSSAHRLASAWLIFALLAGNFSAILEQFAKEQTYRLTQESASLLGHNTNLADKLAFDKKTNAYRFNADAVDTANKNLSSSPSASADPATGGVPDAVKAQLAMQQNVGAADKKDKQLYGVDLPVNANKGITVADTNTKLSFTMTPNFPLTDARVVNGRVVYPLLGTDQQAIYSLKNNGLKEDIVLQSDPTTDGNLTYSYTLKLPDTLVAKLMPNGAVGIYSADPALFGQITASSPDDQKLIDNARKTAEKNYLVFAMPAPTIRQAGSSKAVTSVQTSFELNGNVLTVKANGISKLNYPISVDPSVVVTSTSDFQLGNNEDNNIDFSTAGQINRGALTGGTTGAWASTSSFSGVGSGARWGHASVAYNGYIYIMGGNDGTTVKSDVLYAPINSNGTLGAWATNGSGFGAPRWGISAVAYNGYIYITGGRNAGSFYSDVYYASVNSSGVLGSWNTIGSGFSGIGSGARAYHTTVVYNDYIYVMGGWNASTYFSDVLYASVKADGTLGTWVSTSGFSGAGSGARAFHSSVVSNGYLYIMGGVAGSSYFSDVISANILSDGSVGSWIVNGSGFASAGSGARAYHTSVVYNGYVYIMGGYGGSYFSDTLYAPINANGVLGGWASTVGFANAGSGARQYSSSVTYNGYVYATGGINGSALADTIYVPLAQSGGTGSWTQISSGAGALNSTALASVEYSQLGSNGAPGTWTQIAAGSSGALNTARYGLTTVVYNGIIYAIGGVNTSGIAIASVEYAQLGSNGVPGTWTQISSGSGALITARAFHSSVAYNGYIYAMGNSGGSISVEYSQLSSNGTPGTWTQISSGAGAMITARYWHTSVVYNGYVYAVGGLDGSGNKLTSVEYSLLGSNGAPGAWTQISSGAGALNTARVLHSSAVYNGYIYAVGGQDSSNTTIGTIEYAQLGSNGAPGAWTQISSGSVLNTARRGHASVAYGGYVYSLGGYNSGGTIIASTEYAQISSVGAGITGKYSTTTSLAAARVGHASVAYNGFVYVVGGSNNAGTYLSDVIFAAINSDGTLGSWSTTSSFSGIGSGARSNHVVVAYGGYMYITGGYFYTGSANVWSRTSYTRSLIRTVR